VDILGPYLILMDGRVDLSGCLAMIWVYWTLRLCPTRRSMLAPFMAHFEDALTSAPNLETKRPIRLNPANIKEALNFEADWIFEEGADFCGKAGLAY